MIQRIQSVYLFLTTLLSLLFLKGSFLTFIDNSGSVIQITFKGIIRDTNMSGFELIEKLLPLSVIIILIPVLSIITILLFKNRRIQLRFALSVILLICVDILVSIYYSWFVIAKYEAGFIPGFKMIIPLLMLISAVIAYRGIRKDDQLVKSYDRLR
jgi:hypothetical protein